MAKEFDIYLNRRLTECDIIVYSIPYRDGLTVMERLILQTCLESYTLQKFVAIEAGSELVAHIDEMIKECREKLDAPLAFGNSADFEVHYALNPVSSKLILNSDTTKFLCNTFASAQNVLEFTASSVYAQTKKPFGKAHTEIEITAELKESLKNALEHHPIIAKSSECMLQIIGSKNMDEYISDRNLSLIYAMQRHMEDKIEKAEKQLSERIDAKADNLIFDQETSTIQLVTTTIEFDEEGEEVIKQTPLGEPIFVRADKAAAIINAEINEDGDLIIFFEDETTTNLGKVVGNDGAVYVPHVDEHRILSFTVEERPGDVPPPVDLNPNDEWGSMGDRDTASNYVWEEM